MRVKVMLLGLALSAFSGLAAMANQAQVQSAANADCCTTGSECCVTTSACCDTSVKKAQVNPKPDSGCCPGPCCEPAADCCN
jgi:hypothetical protein